MVSILRKKIPSIEWRMGDSHYEGFYVRGTTKDRIKIKITKEDGPGEYHLGIYFYATNHDIGPGKKLIESLLLQRDVMRAIRKKDRRLRILWKG